MSVTDVPNLLDERDRDYLPHVSVNGVIFSAHAGVLTVLMMQSEGAGTWSLP